MNDATVYTASVVVDGCGSQPIAVTGSAAQTYTTLLSELNTDTTGGTWSITGGNLLLTSDTTGLSSAIAITDTDLFSTLTDFVAVNAAVDGVSNAGAIEIPISPIPDVTTNKLYNNAGALTWNSIDLTTGINKFAQDNTTTNVTETFNHALGSTDVIVQVYDLTVTPKELMIPSVVSISDANNIQIVLPLAPSIGDYRVVITG